jgi:hypothetical protein
MHPMTTHNLAIDNQRRMLDQAAADRLARIATEGRPSLVARLLHTLRPAPRPAAHQADRRPVTTGRA